MGTNYVLKLLDNKVMNDRSFNQCLVCRCFILFYRISVHQLYYISTKVDHNYFYVETIFVYFFRGWQGLIAYGCHSLVLVIDSKTAQTLQVLERHKANVVKVIFKKV